MKIIVISLADAVQRRTQIQSQLSKLELSFEWLEAVDARQWQDERLSHHINDKELYKNMNNKPIAGSIGCHLSHIKAYENLLSSNDEAVLILEDDAVIEDTLPQTLAKLEQAMQHIDILFLCDRREDKPSVEIGNITQNHTLCVKKFSNIGTTAYVINRRAAHHMLSNHKEFGIEIDCLLNRWWRHDLAVATIKPDLVKDEAAETQIGYELTPLARTLVQKWAKKTHDVKDSWRKRRLFKQYCQKMANSLK